VPHDANLNELRAQVMSGFAQGQRTIIAFGCIGAGLLLGVVGFVVGISRGETNTQGQ
jgi:hypothetical protein